MGFFNRFKIKKETSSDSQGTMFPQNLPEAYRKFLDNHPTGTEIIFNEYEDEDPEFEGNSWNIMGKQELINSWEMNGVGRAMNFECLKLYVQVQREYSYDDFTASNVGRIPLTRVESGFVIGDENGDYLYLDPSDNYSVWIYYHDGGDVLKVADSFEQFVT